MTIPDQKKPLIGVVGPCAAGKTTLIQGLERKGIAARHIAQEHSYVQDMWRRISSPDILIYLDVSFEMTIQRRDMDWRPVDLEEQQQRLRHAREHASLYIWTDPLTAEEVLTQVIGFIDSW